MTDPLSPTTQFHPYDPPKATPVAERVPGRVEQALRRTGLDTDRMRNGFERGRLWARRHPGRLLGGLALAVIGGGLLRGRMRPAGGRGRPSAADNE
ncbi:MAG TPA: hypothetical protein VMS56_04535 [Thermoanaerobaculia bacterium]|nr:hypothetical protein [Thermoanaerobaculia bacterium]